MKEFKYHNRSNGAQSSCLAAITQHCKACKAESIQHGKTASSRKSFLHRYAPHYNAQIRNTQSIPCILYLTRAGSQCHHDASCRMAAENIASMDPYSFGARQQASKNSSLQHCTTTPGTIANFELHRAGSWCAALLLQSAVEAHHLCLQPATTRLWCKCNQQFQDAANSECSPNTQNPEQIPAMMPAAAPLHMIITSWPRHPRQALAEDITGQSKPSCHT